MRSILIVIAFVFSFEASAQSFLNHSYSQIERQTGFPFTKKIYSEDLDNDNLTDFIILSNEIKIYKNIGGNNFEVKRLNKSDIGYDTYNDLVFLDYNNDGLKDLIIASYKVLFLKNKGDFSFELDTAIELETTAFHTFHSLALLDINKDGEKEIIVSGSFRELYSMSKKSDGYFEAPIKLGTFSLFRENIKNIEIIDVDHNGYEDICISLSSEYRAYLNDGSGAFIEKKYNQFSFGIADIDIDGDADGLWYGNNELAIMLNDGNDNFTKFNVDIITNLGFANFLDVDGDGKLDIICGRRYFRSDTAAIENLFYYKNNGNLEFTKIILDNTINNAYERPFIADMNNDSKPDILAIDVNSETSTRLSSLIIFNNKGNDQYQKEWAIHSGKLTFYDWADLDNDGLPDYVYAFGGNGKLFWLKNRGNFKFDKPRVILDTLPFGYNYKVSFHIDDINNDGFKDVYGAANNIEFYSLNKGDNTFYPYSTMDTINVLIQQDRPYGGASDFFQQFQYNDINSDGIDDIIYSNYESSFYRYSLGNGKFSQYYIIPEIVVTRLRDHTVDLVINDVNNDKINDFIYYPSPNDNKFMPYLNNGNTTFTPDTLKSVSGYWLDKLSMKSENFYFRYEDINNDSIPDIMLNRKWFPSQSDGLYNEPRAYFEDLYNASFSLAYSPEFSDLDNDGKKDIIIHSFNSLNKNDSLVYHKNIGNGLFEEERHFIDNTGFVVNPNASRKRFIDLDNDGDLDIAVVSRNTDNVYGEMVILENKLNDNNTITVKCFWDKNENKIWDQNEPVLRNQKVYLNNNSSFAFTNNAGYAYFNLPASVNKVRYKKSELWNLTTDSTYTVSLPQNPIKTYYFGLKQNIIKDSIDVILTASAFRCLRTSNLWLSVSNLGNTEISGNDTLSMSDYLNFVYSNPIAQEINSHKKHWSISSLKPSELQNILIDIESPNTSIDLDSVRIHNAFSGRSIHFLTDKLVRDSIVDIVRCSYDPNMKKVSSDGPSLDSLVLMNTPLEYTIYFQNTGNDTAYTVVIKDTISKSLNINTFAVIANSHQVNVNILNNEVSFTFKDINLVDSSTNELLSQGFVKFKISPLPNLPNNTEVTNKADIYFDFNLPIITNETMVVYVDQLPISTSVSDPNSIETNFIIYPNPASQFVQLEWNSTFTSSSIDIYILDITGRVIQILDNISENNLSLNTSHLLKGMYFISLVQNNKILESKKLVLQ
jgi:uncharacterized repeat protein (TIGR01451 family)